MGPPFFIVPSSPIGEPLPNAVGADFLFDELFPKVSVLNDAIPLATDEFGLAQRIGVQIGENVLGDVFEPLF